MTSPPAGATDPFLSIVLTARNDNYGGDFSLRLQNSITWLTYWVEYYALPCELVIVDYNPVAENAPLLQMLSLPQQRKYLSIRFIQVSAEVHSSLVNPAIRKTQPLFEFNAKNMGIRRAKGEFILCTNADIIFDPAIIEFIAERKLQKGTYYRCHRFDFRKIERYDFNQPMNTLQQIQQNVYRLMLKGYGYNLKGPMTSLNKNWWMAYNALRLVFHKGMQYLPGVSYDVTALTYHTHCSGDFMLMHRDHWFELRGYAEDTYLSTHTDAIFTVTAAISGLREEILPWPVYHQEHERRYKSDFDDAKDNEEIAGMFKRYINDSNQMRATKKPKIVNGEDWGLEGAELVETQG